jgi:hypothetical protein
MKSIAIRWVTPTAQMKETRNVYRMSVLQGKKLSMEMIFQLRAPDALSLLKECPISSE